MIFSHRLRLPVGWICVAVLFFQCGCKPAAVPSTGGLVSAASPGDAGPAEATAAQPTQRPDFTADANAVQPEYTPPPIEPPESQFAAQPLVPGNSPLSADPALPPSPGESPIAANPDLIPVEQANSRGAQRVGTQQPAIASPAAASSSGTSLSIQLSAGVALPQSLPTGTQMGMSVDYIARGRMNRSSRYLWVISGGGVEVETEVQLGVKGTLQAFVPTLRPEDRPFTSRIDEVLPGGQRRSISNRAAMQTSY